MILCLIKPMRTRINNNAFTLVELLMAVGFTVLLMTGVFSFYNASNQIYSSGISGQILQNGANILLSKIIEGGMEAGVVHRLSTAEAYAVACTSNCTPNPIVSYSCGGAPQGTPCNVNNPYSELYFCEDDPSTHPCGPTDTTARWYYLNSTGTSVLYHYPGGGADEKIYTAPEGSTLSLRFSPYVVTIPNPTPPPPTLNVITQDVEIDVALTKNSSSGAASTFVFMRNHPND